MIIGTRGSKLALWQASYIAGQLKDKANIDSDLKIIKTKGDKILDVALAKVGDKGLFVKEIENELLAGNIDIAVHSMKDLPTEIPEGLIIAASSPREDCRDAMVSMEYEKLEDLPEGSVIGSSSLRRRAQVLARRPDLVAKDI
ncbi:MAG: hydroxymethylbilane synthase, partial [Actinobacteria bacterium]